MSRIAAANVVVGHGTSDGTGNEPPSVSVLSVKTDEARGLDEIQRYLDQRDDLLRNVQNVYNEYFFVSFYGWKTRDRYFLQLLL